MKTQFFALVGIFLAVLLLPASAHNCCHVQLPADTTPNYVVIGAFAIHKNATRFTTKANQLSDQLGVKAEYMLNPNRNLYYVYVLVTPDHAEAINEANRLRSQSEFSDTWVYHGPLGETGAGNLPSKGVDINPVTEGKIENVNPSDSNPTGRGALADSENLVTGTAGSSVLASPVNGGTSMADSNTTSATAENSTSASSASLDDGVEGKKFIFSLFRSVDNAKVEGDVDIINTERAKKIGSYKGNVPVKVPAPSTKTGDVTFVCEVFGYRKLQRDLNYNQPIGDDLTMDEDNAVVVPFELVRLQKGDIATMYNVYFFKDAGVMRPESRFEVNSLLEMLKENPRYKIRIHGHTNGGAAGKIISMGDNKNFFSLTNTKESVGSAKKLSEERTRVISEFLVANGIEPTRMQLKAWGGKRPLHDKHSSRAQENVRVEVEILED